MKLHSLLYITLFLLMACGSGSQQTTQTPAPTATVNTPSTSLDDYQAKQPIPNNQSATHLSVLFFGNSHSSQLPALVEAMIKAGNPDKTVSVHLAGGSEFLSERLKKGDSAKLLHQQKWTHLILQGQKYSQSFAVDYPTLAARTWIRMAKSLNVTPILYPEHPRKGNTLDTSYLQNLHMEIAQQEASCVAPVGLTWERVANIHPGLPLHHTDGNHANSTGQILTALVLYEMITGRSADLLPYIPSLNTEQQTQSDLSQLVSETIKNQANCIDLFNSPQARADILMTKS